MILKANICIQCITINTIATCIAALYHVYIDSSLLTIVNVNKKYILLFLFATEVGVVLPCWYNNQHASLKQKAAQDLQLHHWCHSCTVPLACGAQSPICMQEVLSNVGNSSRCTCKGTGKACKGINNILVNLWHYELIQHDDILIKYLYLRSNSYITISSCILFDLGIKI